jgi:DNA-binding LacI/PurR family transcriptional regulator
VFVGRPPVGDTCPYVDVDNRHAGAMATKHLLDSGRRRLACLAGPLSLASAFDRRQGFLDALADAGLPPGPCVETVYQTESGRRAAERLLAVEPHVDGLFAMSDALAVGAIQALNAAGRRVPQDVAVVGFDNSTLAVSATPPLTTVSQPVAQVAAAAAKLLAGRMSEGEWGPHPVVLPTELVVRESA